jgi:DnaJ-class molecular chaperone
MEIADYYYKILDLNNTASKDKIINSYNSKIKKFTGLPFLNNSQETEVKELKRALAVLTNKELRELYDSCNSSKHTESQKMIDHEKKYSKKDRVNSQLVSNRVFQMAGISNIPQKNFDVDRTFFSSNSFGRPNELKSANEDTLDYESIQ